MLSTHSNFRGCFHSIELGAGIRSFVNAACSRVRVLLVDLDVYAFVTTAPNTPTRSINHERTSAPLSGEHQFETWLSGTPAESFALARCFDPALLRIVQSGKTEEDVLAVYVLYFKN